MHSIFKVIALFSVLVSATSSAKGWTRLRPADPATNIHLHVGLRAEDAQRKLQKIALDMANPLHPRFRKHLSSVALQQALQVSAEQYDKVENWLKSVDDNYRCLQGHILEASMTIGQAEQLLNTSYSVYSDGSREIVRSEAIHVPEFLQGDISFIAPTTQFPKARKPADPPSSKLAATPHGEIDRRDSCGSSDYTTPSCVRQIYNITWDAEPNRTTFAVYATEAASYSASDMQSFLSTYNPPAAAANADFEIIGSDNASEGSPGVGGAFETHLDTQTSLGLAWPAQGILYNLGGVFGPNPGTVFDPLVQFLQDLIHNETVPSVVSFSESIPEDQVDADYAKQLCNMMAQVGARGVTLLFSSGDNGPQGDQPSGTHNAVFEPEFPASCPFVTAVGGTTNLADETGATQSTITGLINSFSYIASGGGFSNLFSRPSYQDDTVQPYLDNQVPDSYFNEPSFNPSGRGIPDVAAFSTNFPVVWHDLTIGIGGTSAATPLWAAIITLLNDYEASQNRPTLGFVNPWLYSLPEGTLKDITTGGDNAGECHLLEGCTLTLGDSLPGFNVTGGWDAVTGLGSPVFSKLVEALDERAGCYGKEATQDDG
jgi:tripeptidyl-peptidase I